jgi:hypothetical protein
VGKVLALAGGEVVDDVDLKSFADEKIGDV